MPVTRDIRLTLRDLVRERSYTAAVILTLALAIGANTAIFSAVHTILLKPLPIRNPDEIVICWESDRERNLAVVELSYKNFQDLAAHTRSFSHAAAVGSSTWPDVLEGRGEPMRVSIAGVSGSFFDTLGVSPALGRTFTLDDDLPNAPPVVILSHGIWTSRFGANPAVVGSTVHMEADRTIVGVMPRDFDYPRATDFWIPVVPILAKAGGERLEGLRDVGVLFVIGRLRQGVSTAMARDELDRISTTLQQQKGAAHRFGASIVVTPLLDHLLGPVRQALWALLAAVAVLLLIGCANVSGLMLTRVSLRQRDQAVRIALGAARMQLARQWLIETIVLSAAGGCLGFAASHWIVRGIIALAPDDIPRLADVTVDLTVAAFTFVAVVTTAILCGTGPVRYAGTMNLVEALNDAARSTPGRHAHRVRSLLLIVQMALTVVLLVAAGLVVRSFVNLRSLDLGFVPANVVTMKVSPRTVRMPGNEWVAQLLQHLQTTGGIQAAGAVYLRPLALGPIGQETGVVLEGQPLDGSAQRNPALNYQIATPGYFTAMRIRLVSGRLFDDGDTARSTRVALVGESTARRLWPGASPIGKRILMPTQAPEGPETAWRTIVGVVSDVRYRGLDDVRLDVYDAALQSHMTANDLVVRTTLDVVKTAAAVQAHARRLDPAALIEGVTTMEAIVARASAPWRFSVWMFTLFALLAFTLATVGLFSLVSLDIAHRRHELAVRIALGASDRNVLRTVLASAAWRVVPGVALGLLASVAGTRLIQSILFGVHPLDLATYIAVVALVAGVVMVASYIPARRAAEIDPLALLRR